MDGDCALFARLHIDWIISAGWLEYLYSSSSRKREGEKAAVRVRFTWLSVILFDRRGVREGQGRGPKSQVQTSEVSGF